MSKRGHFSLPKPVVLGCLSLDVTISVMLNLIIDAIMMIQRHTFETFSFILTYIIHAIAVTFPLDLVRRRMQLEGAGGRARVYKTGLFGTFRHIFRSEGFRGLYRGILPEYYKVVPGVSIVFMTYEKLKQLLSNIPSS